MKVLLDSCLSGLLKQALEAGGHAVEWAGSWPKDPGDEEILLHAYNNKQILITLDKDFGELAVVYDRSHCGIVRLVNMSIQTQITTCRHVLEYHHQDLRQGAIITAERGRLRIRSPEE